MIGVGCVAEVEKSCSASIALSRKRVFSLFMLGYVGWCCVEAAVSKGSGVVIMMYMHVQGLVGGSGVAFLFASARARLACLVWPVG